MNYYKAAEKLKQKYRGELAPPDPAWPEDIRTSTICIHANLYIPRLTVAWLKEECNITCKNFSGKFCLYKGYTPKRYILHHRLQTGKIILQKLDVTVTLVALSVGFESLSAFCKAFKRRE